MPEPAGFESFFEENRAKVFGAMCLVTGNRQEAEEIAQDAFLRLWQRWGSVSKLEDPTGYLFRTAMNVFRNRARRAAIAVRKIHLVVRREPGSVIGAAEGPGDGSDHPDLPGPIAIAVATPPRRGSPRPVRHTSSEG